MRPRALFSELAAEIYGHGSGKTKRAHLDLGVSLGKEVFKSSQSCRLTQARAFPRLRLSSWTWL